MLLDASVPLLNGEVLVQPSAAPLEAKVRETTKSASTGETQDTIVTDVMVIGAGFSGITAIHRFRKLGLKVKCFESGEGFGGVWYW